MPTFNFGIWHSLYTIFHPYTTYIDPIFNQGVVKADYNAHIVHNTAK